MNFILGSRGRLGSALAAALKIDGVIEFDRSIYADWLRDGASNDIARHFEASAEEKGVVYVAVGITNPSQSHDEHHAVNFVLARNVVQGATKSGLRVVTFGTVMEHIGGDRSA